MANEITVTQRLQITKGSLKVDTTQIVTSITMSGSNHSDNTQSIPTTAAGTAVTIAAAVATYGVSRFTNLDGTNYVDLGVQVSGTFYPLVKLKPGESYSVRLNPGATLYARANTSAVALRSEVAED